jgi:addiction module RelE/StbE family toxin
MQVGYHKNFKKRFRKLSRKIQEKFEERLQLFVDDQLNPILNNHALSGEKYVGCRSIDVTGDVRAIFFLKDDVVIFLDIGSHSYLYG